MIYVVSGVYKCTHYKPKFHEASDYKLSPVSLQFLFFLLLFIYLFIFVLNIILH